MAHRGCAVVRPRPVWRPDLAAEIAAHRQVRMRASHLAPQVAGLLCDYQHCLSHEPRMLDYAGVVLAEAEAALPYGRAVPAGYAPRRHQLTRRGGLVSDAGPAAALAERWG